jgi:hypothetical protein
MNSNPFLPIVDTISECSKLFRKAAMGFLLHFKELCANPRRGRSTERWKLRLLSSKGFCIFKRFWCEGAKKLLTKDNNK